MKLQALTPIDMELRPPSAEAVAPAAAVTGLKPSLYMRIVFAGMLALFLLFTFASPLGYILPATFAGLLCIGFWRHAGVILGPVIALGLALMWILYRASVPEGADFSDYETYEKLVWLKACLQAVCYVPVVIAGFRLSLPDAQSLMKGFTWGALFLAGLALFEAATQARVYMALAEALGMPIRPDLAVVKISLMSYGLMMIYWPMMLYFNQTGANLPRVLLTASVAIAPFFTGANAPTLALVASVIIFFVVRRWSTLRGVGIEKYIAIAVYGVILGFPLLIKFAHEQGWLIALKNNLPPSWLARVEIWEYAANRLFEKPLMGWGFDTSRMFSPHIPLHPHNMPVQAALELGYVGLVLVAVLWLVSIRRVGKTPDAQIISPDHLLWTDPKPYMLATMTAFFVFAFLSFGLWQEWFLALAAMSVFIALMAQKASLQVIMYQNKL
ncbi:O-antigen ligase family protein [Asticcacaulis endophyticus]|uniref:Polymerase n=1 Tax=Asticcacaulis endophyticus TaxID=1395890 RepID=A0A918QA17_9CAUL|nr:O-antigen ligase family protein [Asticcacaulis endophyticus]GGZ36260.1 polymerase [Asticcacaulis endophyticus]